MVMLGLAAGGAWSGEDHSRYLLLEHGARTGVIEELSVNKSFNEVKKVLPSKEIKYMMLFPDYLRVMAEGTLGLGGDMNNALDPKRDQGALGRTDMGPPKTFVDAMDIVD
ncbi:hypothetical protein NDU88_002570 [Pleurodeles waltl]|uniref:Uncharacterized protein n=1 Tax=Pleurodeles waltl TaxID=8319 RepID=A0AAV7T2S7_PLEWA|nr:hypothetical protein NDU88_002570 [Pleurodeles waltl]